MWAHYSDNHKGAVIQFKCLAGNHTLSVAQNVIYSIDMPKLTVEDMVKTYTSAENHIENKIINEILLTKSIDWEYEDEWRVILKKLNPSAESDIRGICPEEIDAIYLGCEILPEDEEKIISIKKEKLNHVKIYKSQKNKSQFKLDFIKLDV